MRQIGTQLIGCEAQQTDVPQSGTPPTTKEAFLLVFSQRYDVLTCSSVNIGVVIIYLSQNKIR